MFFSKKIKLFLLACSAVFLPHLVFASTLYVGTDHSDVFVGDTILFSVRIDSENRDINAVEGEVALDYSADAASLADINTAGSKFSLWPAKPSPSENNTSISFVGGSPGGLITKDAIVFSFVLKLQKSGQITLSPKNIGVYLNDGKGTKDAVGVKDLTVNVLPEKSDAPSADDWDAIISKDKTAPESFKVTLGKDSSIFNNQYFISFFTTDAQSGVAYYEVQEGGSGYARTESPYLLQDQSLKNLIKVNAIDKAGNERIEEFMPSAPTAPFDSSTEFWIVVSLVITARSYVLWRKFVRKVKK
jgi:hypothetical protein